MGCLPAECCHICHFLIRWCCLPAGSMHKGFPGSHPGVACRACGNVSVGKGLALPPGDNSLQGTDKENIESIKVYFRSISYDLSTQGLTSTCTCM